MGIRHDICEMVKRAQLWSGGSFAPAHDAAEAGSHARGSYKEVPRAIWKGLSAAGGALVGAGKSWWDTVGSKGFNSGVSGYASQYYNPEFRPNISEYADAGDQIIQGARIGAKIGWRDADRTWNDTKLVGARVASNFGLMGDDKILAMQRENDKKILEQINRANSGDGYKFPVPADPPKDRDGLLAPVMLSEGIEDPRYSEYNNYIKWARGGQGLADASLTTAADLVTSRGLAAGAKSLTGKVMSKIKGIPADAVSVPRAVTWTAGMAPSVPVGIKANYRRDLANSRDRFDIAVGKLSALDPSSPEYQSGYEALSAARDLDQAAFDRLPKPVPQDAEQPGESSENAAVQPAGQGWSMSPGTQNMIGYGLGGAGIGALLGALFGGKGGLWKLGLLGLLLGAIHGGGGLGNVWGKLQNAWNGAPR